MGNDAKVHHEVGTKENNKIIDRGVVHIVTLEYCNAKRNYAGKVDKEQCNRIGPTTFDVVVVVVDVVMVVKKHTCQHKNTAQDAENGRAGVSC